MVVPFGHLPPQIRSALDRITPLSFGIVGKSLNDGDPWAVGSGVFIAPYYALTARHIVEATWNRFEPEWEQNKFPTTTDRTSHFLVLTQKLYAGRPGMAAWRIEEIVVVAHTDLAILRVTAHDDMAKAYQWGNGFLNLQLLPPPLGSEVYVFGYPGSEAENDDEQNVITGDFQIKIFPALVTKIEEFRRDRSLTNFPGFEFEPGAEGGTSGGPVFFENKLCGIVSAGGSGPNPLVGYAAALWPLIFRTIRIDIGGLTTMLDLMKSRFIPTVDVGEAERRAYLEDLDDGGLDGPKPYARLRPA